MRRSQTRMPTNIIQCTGSASKYRVTSRCKKASSNIIRLVSVLLSLCFLHGLSKNQAIVLVLLVPHSVLKGGEGERAHITYAMSRSTSLCPCSVPTIPHPQFFQNAKYRQISESKIRRISKMSKRLTCSCRPLPFLQRRRSRQEGQEQASHAQ